MRRLVTNLRYGRQKIDKTRKTDNGFNTVKGSIRKRVMPSQ